MESEWKRKKNVFIEQKICLSHDEYKEPGGVVGKINIQGKVDG